MMALPTVLEELINDFPELPSRFSEDEGVWKLNVQNLPPPEPMEMTLAVLNFLPGNVRLLQNNQRVPRFLLPLLEDLKMKATVLKEETNDVLIEISHL